MILFAKKIMYHYAIKAKKLLQSCMTIKLHMKETGFYACKVCF